MEFRLTSWWVTSSCRQLQGHMGHAREQQWWCVGILDIITSWYQLEKMPRKEQTRFCLSSGSSVIHFHSSGRASGCVSETREMPHDGGRSQQASGRACRTPVSKPFIQQTALRLHLATLKTQLPYTGSLEWQSWELPASVTPQSGDVYSRAHLPPHFLMHTHPHL